jgi:hypothetical protein
MNGTSRVRAAGLAIALVLAGCQGRRETQFQIATPTADAEFETVREHVRDVARELTLVEKDSPIYEPYAVAVRESDSSSWFVVAVEAYPATERVLVNVEHDYALWSAGRPGNDVYVSVVGAMRDRLAASYPDALLETEPGGPEYARERPGTKAALHGR